MILKTVSKTKILTVVLVFLFLFAGCAKIKESVTKLITRKLPTQKLVFETDSGKHELTVEVADESKERAKGYMSREKIEKDGGMWFVFDAESELKFWMRNMKLPLDIVYVNKDFEIRAILKNVPPCEKDPCVTYDSPADTQYALEVPAGYTDEIGAETGDRISLP